MVSMEITLPEDELDQVKNLLAAWKGNTRRELQSLIGHLQYAAKVVGPGRFIRGMLSLLQGLKSHIITPGTMHPSGRTCTSGRYFSHLGTGYRSYTVLFYTLAESKC